MTVRMLHGDCREVLPMLEAGSVHCCVTSPPYYGLRDYGTGTWDGGDAGCDHRREEGGGTRNNGRDRAASGGMFHDAASPVAGLAQPYRNICGKCGARRIDAQIGLEATPDEYLATMVAVFRGVRRVLRDDATCWVNVGDSYAGNANSGGANQNDGGPAFRIAGLAPKQGKPKDLLMMPARLALALQADGWWLRSDIIWAKPNPMPESVTDRPTSAHEHVFLLAKQPRYFYDADAVREEQSEASLSRYAYGFNDVGKGVGPDGASHTKGNGADGGHITPNASGLNLRNVWTIATSPFSAAHFATFPPELAERCIRAGTSERGCCAACGAPWVRMVESMKEATDRPAVGKALTSPRHDGNTWNENNGRGFIPAIVATLGWSPSCQCSAGTRPCVVLDPFAGAGTVGLVADRLQRNAVQIELNSDYCSMARTRILGDAPLFAEVAD